jgi:hypothetical protein
LEKNIRIQKHAGKVKKDVLINQPKKKIVKKSAPSMNEYITPWYFADYKLVLVVHVWIKVNLN